ncbi:hypothetical protein [Halomonas sp. A11-A]|uniref:hypothetical protein n=1 Tax=Halomonas sp. A11-A TaxID=2183985 RepID=UPI000D7166FC|nr:hypothetical protein [Halomonas sp. A11-A]PWV70546.1 hypothetical protein DER72_12528 [Halomonas sp. A11-A]
MRCSAFEIVASLAGQGVILGCTESGLLIQSDDTDVPLFVTTAIHDEQVVEAALATNFYFATPHWLT